MNNTKEQVFQLFVEKLSGCISLEEAHALEERLASDPGFQREWQRLEERASELGMHAFLSELDASAGLEEIRGTKRSAGREEISALTGRRIGHKKALAAAAAVLLAAAGVWLLFPRTEKIADKAKIAELVKEHQQSVRLDLGGKQVELGGTNAGKSIAVGNTTLQSGVDALQYNSQDTSMSTLSVPPGATYKIVLSDGTEVWLNAATRLRFPLKFPAGHRDVEVEGEAFFKVAKNASAPFIVHTSLTDVRVLGTSFNVNTYQQGNVRTALVEGKVITQCPDGQALSLMPGFVSEYGVSKGFSSTTFEQDDELSWMNGVYYFHDMTIESLVQVASRCYGIHMVLNNGRLAGESLTGVLERGKLSEFLNDLETTAHIKYYYSNKDLYLE
jgi:ferric-dicitrate binding protein FerR (iron transport regulator)